MNYEIEIYDEETKEFKTIQVDKEEWLKYEASMDSEINNYDWRQK